MLPNLGKSEMPERRQPRYIYFIYSRPLFLVQMETLCTTIRETPWDVTIATNRGRSTLTTQYNYGTYNEEQDFLCTFLFSLLYKVLNCWYIKIFCKKKIALPPFAAVKLFSKPMTKIFQDKNLLSLYLLFSSCLALWPSNWKTVVPSPPSI